MKITLRIARTELASLFYSPIAWFILIVFSFLTAMSFTSEIESTLSYLDVYGYSYNSSQTFDTFLSINAFLKEYNKTHGYSLIFSNTGFDNLLYADSAFNITKEIVDGLNARYSPAANK